MTAHLIRRGKGDGGDEDDSSRWRRVGKADSGGAQRWRSCRSVWLLCLGRLARDWDDCCYKVVARPLVVLLIVVVRTGKSEGSSALILWLGL